MSQELKEAITALGTVVHEFKAENDKQLAELKKNMADPLLAEKVDKLNARITELANLKERIEGIELKAARPGGFGQSQADEAKAKHNAAFANYFRTGDSSELQAMKLANQLVTGDDSAAGWLAGEEVDLAIDRVQADFSPMRALATVRKINGLLYKKYVSQGGSTSGWVGEENDRTETGTPTLDEIVINLMTLYAEPHTSNDMVDFGIIDIPAWLSDEVLIEFGEQEGDKFWRGNGIKQPRGIGAYPTVANASYSWGKLGYIASGAAGAFAASNPSDKLIDLQHSLKRGFRKNGVWMMNDLTFAGVRKLKDSNGDYLWKAGLEAGASTTLLGKPVETDDFMPDIAANALAIAFGDFKRGYLIVESGGVMVLRDQLTRKGFTKFYTTKKVGGGVQNFEAIKLMKFAAS